jgi:periplasmic divalent cation tolerance protein
MVTGSREKMLIHWATAIQFSSIQPQFMEYIEVVTTCGDRTEARAIARSLVERKLVACARIAEIESFYVWQGGLQEDQEYEVSGKTTSDRYQEVESAIRELHSYDLPDIHARAIAPVYAPYGEWLKTSLDGPP